MRHQQSARTTFYAAALARHLPGITQLAADFQAEAWFEKLAEAGFDSAGTTFFLWEAVTMYLGPQRPPTLPASSVREA
ncbi:class I SAM-dependent methyltransferase [Pseudarthrobacter cellobiosi]|uniref:class I SAM-dependent methyltransferase n=1 Tax=Pseudarthrobacter cellobiosi TaxID=2953654 RepID=UPI00208ECFB8|nr:MULTISPECIES: class I SAM-dependent methyltransferase [unclassified Pseudarthrobacter]MCO4255579.1 class I SAM-dependent methyltransferase [Pseudarthrobacter sp. HLT1-5]MCO4273603.1 class I SAM-dependent methyltransferase [Pseudarthrobacter sp. HLT3-5]